MNHLYLSCLVFSLITVAGLKSAEEAFNCTGKNDATHVSGRIEAIRVIDLGWNRDHLLVRVRTDDLRTATVDLGDPELIWEEGVDLGENDLFCATGTIDRIRGRNVLKATRFNAAGQQLDLDEPAKDREASQTTSDGGHKDESAGKQQYEK